MKFSILLISFIIGILFTSYHVKRIPAGYEMGAILIMFVAFIIFCVIYIFYLILFIGIWSQKPKKRKLLLTILFIIYCSISYYSSWRICVYEEPMPTKKEIMAKQYENYFTFKNYYYRIPKIIKEGEFYRPQKKVVKNDSLTILNSFKEFLNIPLYKLDSVNEYKIINLFYPNWAVRIKNNPDSIEIKNHLKLISKTIKIRNLFYSPNFKKIIFIISFKENEDNKIKLQNDGSGNAMALFGFKYKKRLIVFKHHNFNNLGYFKNDNIAYSYCFKTLIEDEYRENLLTSNFWDNYSLLKKINESNEQEFHISELDKNGQKYNSRNSILIINKK